MNSPDAKLIADIAKEVVGLTVGRCYPVPEDATDDYVQIHLIYADEKRSTPRSPGTLIALFYDAFQKRQVSFGIGSSKAYDSEFPTLIFTRARQAVKHG